ncbi:peptide-methionine (S)-S-oxide reductase MsrA [Spiroplasma endosymbiont of Anurida maritima]|uniref:peptide-methionine (S)-S-oxide reductase MsrA n=1 Tax=Spiroplasma endosymbiont of Anurida maritima TaxID=2967972 RepID=UPI0036D2752E
MKTLYVGAGCFWGVEKYLGLFKGVINTEVGYANGNTKNTNYDTVCSGEDNFVEVVKVTFDNTITSLSNILEYVFKVIDPTSLNKQGNDTGVQYRTGFYYSKEDEKDFYEEINLFLKEQQTHFSKRIVVENLTVSNYVKAEEFHQKYLNKNPGGYCHIKFD